MNQRPPIPPTPDVLFTPRHIGSSRIENRIVRAGTAETMADVDGRMTDEMVALHVRLARSGVGLAITGHMYVDDSGKATNHQTAISRDDHLPGLSRLATAVHAVGGKIFAQLSHAGSQTKLENLSPVAPSAVANPLTGRVPEAMSPGQIEQLVESFGASAQRAVEAGFDGVHLHGANGYLISEFASQVTNRRTDQWGGAPERRDAFPLAVVDSIRRNVPADFPVSMKVGLEDRVDGGVELEESLQRTMKLVAAGLDAVEVSCGLMTASTDSAARYVNVGRRQALADVLPGALLGPAASEAYFRPWASALATSIDVPIILTGGVRSAPTMRSIVESGDAQFIGLARPLIRQPDLVSRLRDGGNLPIACTSCNLCMRHSGTQSLRCWRVPKRRLLAHVFIAGVEQITSLRAGAG